MIPPLPEGSSIHVERVDAGYELKFHVPRVAFLFRWGAFAFILFWLGGWAAGEGFVLWALFSSKTPWPVRLFLAVWLAAWTYGGITAIRHAIALVRKPQAETLLIESNMLTWKPANTAIQVESKVHSSFLRKIRSSSLKTICIPREEIISIASEAQDPEFGEQLVLRHGEKSYFIGSALSDEETRWLCGLLNEWKISAG